MKIIVKLLNIVEWISAITGALLVLLGSISLIFRVNILPVNSMSNIFSVASSFFLLTIVLFLFIHLGQFKKE